MPNATTANTGEYWYADVVERLFEEFENRYPLPTIVATAKECREQLDISPEAALPELVERLARQRLNTVARIGRVR